MSTVLHVNKWSRRRRIFRMRPRPFSFLSMASFLRQWTYRHTLLRAHVLYIRAAQCQNFSRTPARTHIFCEAEQVRDAFPTASACRRNLLHQLCVKIILKITRNVHWGGGVYKSRASIQKKNPVKLCLNAFQTLPCLKITPDRFNF